MLSQKHSPKLSLVLGALLLSGAVCGDEIRYTRQVETVTPELGTRPRQTEKPYIFAEVIAKYGMYQNFLHYYIERPLFFDRSLRDEYRFQGLTRDNFIRYEIPAIRSAGIDGFGTFCVSRNSAIYQYLKWLREDKIGGFLLLPEFLYGEKTPRGGVRNLDVSAIAEMVNLLKGSEIAAQTRSGKVILGSWNSQVLPISTHREMLEHLRQTVGHNNFCLTGELHAPLRARLEAAFRSKGALSAEERREYRNAVQQILDLFGGLQMCVQNRERKNNGDFPVYYSTEYFERERLKLLNELFSRPENQDKLLGCIIYQGYVNPMLGYVIGEYGTSALRHAMDSTLKLNPDYIILFEWNEANENTEFQPSVYNGMSVSRIVRYYSNILKGIRQTPLEGDDVTRPNLILSHRAALKIGETIRFELLNLPDGSGEKPYQVQLLLCTPDGRELHRFPVETFAPDQLQAITYSLPSEQFSTESFIQPHLLVDGKEIAGFGGIRLASTFCTNYKELRQAVRDLMQPKKCNLTVTPLGGGQFRINAEFSGKDSLSSLEVLEDEDELCASDPDHEFDYDRNQLFYAAFTTNVPISNQELKLSVEGVSSWKIRPCHHCNIPFGTWSRRGNEVIFPRYNFTCNDGAMIIEAPRDELDQARLKVSIPGRGEWVFPLRPVFERGAYGSILLEDNPLRLDLRRLDNLPDIPNRIQSTAAGISRIIRTANRFPTFHLRAISRDGRIFRSPAVVPLTPEKSFRKIDVFSDTDGRPVIATLPAQKLTVIDYLFDPAGGHVMYNSLHPQFNAQLGGGFPYMEPFWEHSYWAVGPQPPSGPGNRAPSWKQEDGRWILEFDGNDYLNFPNTMMPLGAFTLEFEIAPENDTGTMVLFRHSNRYTGSLSLFTEKGSLRGAWLDKNGKVTNFRTGLKIPAGRWSTVKVSYDLRQLKFEVNGRARVFPFSGRAFLIKSSIFGGHTGNDGVNLKGKNPRFFSGKLRRLTMKHFADR